MHLEPSNAIYIFCPITPTIQGDTEAKFPCYYPSELKNSHQVRLQVAARQPVSAAVMSATAQIPDGTMETDECYDGFRYLYSEDRGADGGRGRMGGLCSQLRSGGCSSPCPPLQPPGRE